MDKLSSGLLLLFRWFNGQLYQNKGRWPWGRTIVVCIDMQTLLVQSDWLLNIWYIVYLGWWFLSFANVFCSGISILDLQYNSLLNLWYLLYLSWWSVNWANLFCLGVDILHPQSDYPLNICCSLPRLMVYSLGQWALLRCKHPSSPIWFSPKYWYFFYPDWWFAS